MVRVSFRLAYFPGEVVDLQERHTNPSFLQKCLHHIWIIIFCLISSENIQIVFA